MPEEKQNISHSLILQDRKKLNLSGVCDVNSFDEGEIVVETVMGEITIRGEELHIAGFNRETGDMSVEGRVCAFAYTSDGKKNNSLFGRIFR
ncbi:MAG: sporulation protein YabP [Ruminococcaceae bacterium]|nr:sporulation protein YabP [Oscillospiraceae bacterium]